MLTYYALLSLDEIYQAIWRTAVRNDRPVEVIVALADEHWLTTRYRTVMPQLNLASAYRERDGVASVEVAGSPQGFKWAFERDDRLYGMSLVEMPAGQEISKRQMAAQLGYAGAWAWEKNKGVIMALMDPFFEDGNNKQYLRHRTGGEVGR